MSERPRSGELEPAELCAKLQDQPRPTLCALPVAVMPKQWFDCASDASLWWQGLPALVLCGSLPQPAALTRFPPHFLRKAGRSALCARCQHGSTGHSSCCLIHVTALPDRPVCRDLAPYAGTVALATAHAPADSPRIGIALVQRALGHATWVCRAQLVSKWAYVLYCTPPQMLTGLGCSRAFVQVQNFVSF